MRVTRLTEYYAWRIGINGLCPQCIHTNERRVLHILFFQHNAIMVRQYCEEETKNNNRDVLHRLRRRVYNELFLVGPSGGLPAEHRRRAANVDSTNNAWHPVRILNVS
uniref:Uncharacterized protein n=1 Tax=Schizaphis graminum TaxID=13262 RepID=A0A2S2PBY5_SCHGA